MLLNVLYLITQANQEIIVLIAVATILSWFGQTVAVKFNVIIVDIQKNRRAVTRQTPPILIEGVCLVSALIM